MPNWSIVISILPRSGLSYLIEILIRLKQGTNNNILDNASIHAAQINTRWMQTLPRILKTNWFAYVLFNTQNLNGDQLSKQFLNCPF